VNSGERLRMNCETVQSLVLASRLETLDAERLGRVQGHIAVCDRCLERIGRRIAVSIVDADLPISSRISVCPVESPAAPASHESSLERNRAKLLGISWQRERACISTLSVERKKRIDAARESLKESFGSKGYSKRGRGIRRRGTEPRIQLLDEGWNIVPDVSIPYFLVEGPEILAGGELSLILEVPTEEFRRYKGRTVIGVLSVGGEKLSFESILKGSRVDFEADGLVPESGAMLEPELFDFYLAPQSVSS
jgi:hypothetical protein